MANETSTERLVKSPADDIHIREMMPIVSPHGVTEEKLVKAYCEASLVADQEKRDMDDRKMYITSFVLWQLFANDSSLWIPPKTKVGNNVTIELMTMVYVNWEKYLSYAERHGIESAQVAGIVSRIAHKITDMIANHMDNGTVNRIKNLNNYIYSAVGKICRKQEKKYKLPADVSDVITKEMMKYKIYELSSTEKKTFCNEILNLIPTERDKMIFRLRVTYGYKWSEIAKITGISSSVATKSLSRALLLVLGITVEHARQSGAEDVDIVQPRRLKTYLLRNVRKNTKSSEPDTHKHAIAG